MADLTITGSVTRTELALADLALNDDTYKIIRGSWGPGEVVWRRQAVSSPYVDGSFLVNATRDQVTTPLGIRVTGSSRTDCMNKVGTLCRAFEQFSYELTITVDGTDFTYTCDPADYSWGEGGALQTFHIKAYKQEVNFMIPRSPIPVAGPV